MESFIHPSAIVDNPNNIKAGTKIWHFTHVCANAKIGENCSLGQNVYIGNDVTLGNNVKVQNNVSIYDAITIEDDVFCGPSMVFTNVINPRSHVVRKNEYKKTTIRKGATLGANCTVVCGVEIGQYAMVGAGSVVTKSILPYSLVVGVPAKHISWICSCGIKIQFKNHTTNCPECHKEYYLKNNFCSPTK